MSFLPGIFGRANAQNNQQQQQQPQNGPAPQNQQQMQPHQQNNNGSAGPAGNQQQGNANSQMNGADPMAPFMQLMMPKQGQQQQQQQDQGLFGQVDPKQIDELVNQQDYTSGIDPQLVQKALSGDQQSFMQVLNSVARGAFKNSFEMSRGMVEHGVKTGTEKFGSTLDSRFRDYELRNQTVDSPELNNPFSQVMLNGIKQQIAQNNPKLAAREVHAQAVEAMKTWGTQVFGASQQQQQQQNQPQQKDWFQSFGLDDTGSM